MSDFDPIFNADLPDLEKLARAFQGITDIYLKDYQNEIELLKAVNDPEALVKEQIKLGMMKQAREIFQYCYFRVAGKKAWHEQDHRS
jgi:hypothetical protein